MKDRTVMTIIENFVGLGAEFVSSVTNPAMPEREVNGKKLKAVNAKLRMTFEQDGKEHRIVMERFPMPDFMAEN